MYVKTGALMGVLNKFSVMKKNATNIIPQNAKQVHREGYATCLLIMASMTSEVKYTNKETGHNRVLELASQHEK